jgi:KDO2-lipid IV(A) lauroyltransferase
MSVKDPFQQLVDEITLIRQDMERLKRTSLDKDDAEALHEMLAEGVDRMRKVGPEVQKAVEMRLLGVAAVLREETAKAAASAAEGAIEQTRAESLEAARSLSPDMPRPERMRLCRNIGRNMGRTLYEIYNCAEFQRQPNRITTSGPGLGALEAARSRGKGAIIVSGHFGQWEAIRAVLKARGMETGAVYRPQSNRHYQRRLLAGIQAGGLPIMPTGKIGTKALVSHLRSGGFIAILLDEKVVDGVRMSFLGHDALTSLAAARLALKYDIPMVPAYGTRTGDGSSFAVEFEAQIPPSDALAMTQAFNDSLSARILDKPDQWYWMLRRWQGL